MDISQQNKTANQLEVKNNFIITIKLFTINVVFIIALCCWHLGSLVRHADILKVVR